MKKLLFIAIMAIFFVGCTSTNKFNSLNLNGLKGNVKSVSTACYMATERFGEIQKEGLIESSDEWIPLFAKMIFEFNEYGNMQKETYLNSRGEVYRLIRHENQGINIIATYVYDYDGELAYSWKTIFEDGKPKNIERFSRYEDTKNETIECDFDGLCAVSERHYKDGVITKTDESVYQNNLLCSFTSTDKDGNVTYQLNQEYTKDGQLAYRRHVSGGEDCLIEITTFNEKGLPVKYSRSGKWSNGNVDCTFEYSAFDKKGNWLSRIIKIEDKPVCIQERTIEYY